MIMKLLEFSLLLVLLIAFSATLTLSEESEEDSAATEDATEETEGAEATNEGAGEESVCEEGIDDEVKEEDDVLVLTTKTFDSVVKDNDVMLVEFYAPWLVNIYVSCFVSLCSSCLFI